MVVPMRLANKTCRGLLTRLSSNAVVVGAGVTSVLAGWDFDNCSSGSPAISMASRYSLPRSHEAHECHEDRQFRESQFRHRAAEARRKRKPVALDAMPRSGGSARHPSDER